MAGGEGVVFRGEGKHSLVLVAMGWRKVRFGLDLLYGVAIRRSVPGGVFYGGNLYSLDLLRPRRQRTLGPNDAMLVHVNFSSVATNDHLQSCTYLVC